MPTLRFLQHDSIDDLGPALVSTEPVDGAPLAHLLVRLGRQDASGVLVVKRDDGFEATCGLSKGSLQRIASRGFDDDTMLTARLRAQPGLDQARLEAVLRAAAAEKKPVSVSLFRAGLVTVQELAHAMRAGRVELVERCLAPGSGQVTFTARDDVPKDPIAIPLAPLLFSHYRARVEACSLKELEPRLGNLMFRFPLATFETPLYARGAENDLVEQYCTGNLNTRTVIDKGKLGPVRGARLLLLLFAFELLDARVEPLRITQNLDVKEAVEARLAAVNTGSHFEILDVHWTAHPREIETKYRQEVARFEGYLTREGLSDELTADVRLVRLAFDEAWRVLSDPSQRHAYRSRSYTRQQIEFAASFLHQQSELAVFRADERTARLQLEAALDLSGDKRYADALATLWERIHGDGAKAEIKHPDE
jgi:hypothetical protein